jgi:mannose-1-phosphate guanylyltransferase
MVQRVYRQITRVDKNASLTIATSKTQVSAIHNQLGDHVSVCVEPMRRDTFPAVALSCAYLHDELGVKDDEAVIVCPVDPYVDDSYYEAVARLDGLVKGGKAAITLMGIEPTYPSDKYGYIIPKEKSEVSPVLEFKEKPDTATAKEYLKKGALWNAGVFAFRLGYMMKRAHELLSFKDYRDLYEHYGDCQKISFDYAVLEKEPSIQVLRYAGGWKDVGTWNMMSEVMADKVKGNALLDETCENTNVVNELDIPILVMGAKNMVIAASGDGILISDKERSGYMKPFVEEISTDVRYAEKSWGDYKVIDAGPDFLTVKITLKAGTHLSYHSHEFRDEIWTVLSGSGKAVVDDKEIPALQGDVIRLPAGSRHTLIAKTPMVVLESQLGDKITVKDKQKYDFIDGED